MVKRSIVLLLLGGGAAFSLGLAEPQVSQPVKASAATTTYALLDNTFQISHMRVNALDDGTSFGLGTNWQQTTMPALSSSDASFIRGVINAPSAGTYSFTFDYRGAAYPLQVYVNSTTAQSFTLPSTSWAEGTSAIDLALAVGDNAVLFQVNAWGGIKSIAFDSTLTLKSHAHDPNSDGVYYAVGDGYLNDTVLQGYDGDITAAATTVIAAPYKLDSNSEYDGYSQFVLPANATAKSLDITYYQTAYQGSGLNGLSFSVNGGRDSFVEFKGTTINSPLVQNINPTAFGLDLSAGGTLKIHSNSNNSGKIGLVSVAFSTTDPNPVGPQLDYDAHSADTLRNEVTLRGRQFQSSGDIVMDWSGSGIEFSLTNASAAKLNCIASSAKLAWTIDDGEVQRANVATGTALLLAQDLDKTKTHTIKIYKDNEAAGGLCAIHSLEVEKGGVVAKLAAKTLKFDFVGASIVCANQIDHDGNISAYGGFARVLSDLFNADFHSTCVSGRGLMEGYNSEESWAASQTNQLQDLYWQNSHFRDAALLYDTTAYTPDVLIANIGDNDLGATIMKTFSTTIDMYVTALKTFHGKLRTAYPNSEIIYMYGTYQNRRFNSEYQAAVNELAATDSKVDYIYMPFYGDGKDTHPSYAQHQMIASRLASLIEKDTAYRAVSALPAVGERYELENAALLGTGATANTDPGSDINYAQLFSEWGYVGGLGAAGGTNITNPSQIKTDGSNVKIMSRGITITKGGTYALRMGYSTSASNVACYAKVDQEDWQKIDLPSTGGWTTVYESTALNLKLAAGTHTILITGALTSTTWYNADFIELTLQASLPYYTIAYPSSSAYAITGPSSVEEGSSFNFTVTLTANYTKSVLTVKANGTLLGKQNDGSYLVSNVTSLTTITITGEALNQWKLTFKDEDGTIYSQETYEVGAAVTAVADPTKEGYTFTGWDKTVPSTMPNGDLTLTAQWEAKVEPEPSSSGTNLPLILGLSIGGGVLVLAGAGVLVVIIMKKKHGVK